MDAMAEALERGRRRANGHAYGNGQATAPTLQGDPEPWEFICPTSLQGRDIPPRKFIVQDWLPAACVTINYGDGGVGKTLLQQQLMTSCATGHPWCGLAVEKCMSVGLFCEDDEDELHRRQDAINRSYGIDFSALQNMTWTSGVGLDNTLVTFDDDERRVLTYKFEALRERTPPNGLLVIDTAADTFGGNEIVRRQVRQFVGAALGKLAKDTGAAVLLNAHPSRTGMSATGDQDGGSTAWSNTARSRWSLTRPKAEGEEQADTSERILTRRKANYASIGDTIRLRWQNGVLVPQEAVSGLAAMVRAQEADEAFLALLDRVTAEGRPVSDNSKAGNYAAKEFGARPDRAGLRRGDFEAAMGRLFAAGRIRMVEYGRSGGSGRPRRIVRTEGANNA